MHLLNKILICFFIVMLVGNVTTAYAKLCCCFEEQTEQAEAMPCHDMGDETTQQTPDDEDCERCGCMDGSIVKAYELDSKTLANIPNHSELSAFEPKELHSIESNQRFIPPIV